MSKESLTLKWGTLKAWDFGDNEAAMAAYDRWRSDPTALSAMLHHDTAAQKQAICDIIDALNIETVYLDWDGEDVSKDEAKRYVMEYGL